MALSAECTTRLVRIADDNVSTTFYMDNFYDIVVTNNGLLLGSTLVLKRTLSNGATIQSYSFSGTGAECLGIEAAISASLRDAVGSAGYTDWAYP
jgi:hypothetical protein